MVIFMEKYSSREISQIINGYKLLDCYGDLSSLFQRVSHCNKCVSTYPNRPDLPENVLVRSIPLLDLSTEEKIGKYTIRIKRDDTFLRNLFRNSSNPYEVIANLGSAKFAIGLLPWLDRCMLFRRRKNTKLMVIGIDYKHFPVFYNNLNDHNFPLDGYGKRNNIWGPTWKRFWKNLIGTSNDKSVNDFLREKGVFITNSMLCFGGSDKPESHFYGYLECCQNHIEELISIVQPEIIASFGNLGCRNVATILLKGRQNKNNLILKRLSEKKFPLKEMKSIMTKHDCREGIKLEWNSQPIVFWPLYQPARSHIHKYGWDYEIILKRLVGV